MSVARKFGKPPIPVPFTWRPGIGLHPGCVQRMRERIRRPVAPMGEAWFMSEQRHMYGELLGDLNHLTLEELRRPLEEIASGNSSFGPFEEWTDWYRFLLAQLVTRHGECSFDSLYQHLVTAFIAVHPRGIEDPYAGFADDARHTLGRCLMDPSRWTGGRMNVPAPEDPYAGGRRAAFEWSVACGDFSAAMVFCAKYLAEDELEPWLDSVFQIRCPLWTTQLYCWLVEANPLLSRRVLQLGDLKSNSEFRIAWAGSHVLRGDFSGVHQPPPPPLPLLSAERSYSVLASARKHITEASFFAWLDALKPYAYLQALLGNYVNRVAALFAIA